MIMKDGGNGQKTIMHFCKSVRKCFWPLSNQDDLSKKNIIDHDKHLINPFGKLYDLGEILFIIRLMCNCDYHDNPLQRDILSDVHLKMAECVPSSKSRT